MKKGKWILIEGGEGAGKTTVARWLVAKLNRKRKLAYYTREPGGVPEAESLRQIILKKDLTEMAELFCFLAARSLWIERKVKPLLKKNKIVVSDRSYPSTLAYQGAARGLGINKVNRLNQLVLGKLKPALVLILDVEPKTGLQRNKESGGQTRFDEEGLFFNQKVNLAYRTLAKKYGWKIINANQPVDKVKKSTWGFVEEVI